MILDNSDMSNDDDNALNDMQINWVSGYPVYVWYPDPQFILQYVEMV